MQVTAKASNPQRSISIPLLKKKKKDCKIGFVWGAAVKINCVPNIIQCSFDAILYYLTLKLV